MQPPEPREHRHGEGGRSKSKFNFILSYLIVLFFGFSFFNPNYLEIEKYLILKFHAPMIQNILIGNLKLPEVLVFFHLSYYGIIFSFEVQV